MSRIFITGDVHAPIDIDKLNRLFFPVGATLTKDDVLIICGDAGFVWDGSKIDEYWIDWISNQPWTTLYVDGNHENFNLLKEYPIVEKYGAKMHQISESLFHIMRGEIMTINDKAFFCFGGAFSHDVYRRKLNVSWWQQELPTYEECDYAKENLKKHDYKVDYIITHDGPEEVQEIFNYASNNTCAYDECYANINYFLSDIDELVKYKEWFMGHYHVNFAFNNKTILYKDIVELKEDGKLEHVYDYQGADKFILPKEKLIITARRNKLYTNLKYIDTMEKMPVNESIIKVSEYLKSADEYELEQIQNMYKWYKIREATKSLGKQ